MLPGCIRGLLIRVPHHGRQGHDETSTTTIDVWRGHNAEGRSRPTLQRGDGLQYIEEKEKKEKEKKEKKNVRYIDILKKEKKKKKKKKNVSLIQY